MTSTLWCYIIRWIEACIEDELPATTELEEALRNGVILGRLGHFYAPDVLPLRKIYDRDQAKYQVCYDLSICVCTPVFVAKLGHVYRRTDYVVCLYSVVGQRTAL